MNTLLEPPSRFVAPEPVARLFALMQREAH